MQSLKKYYNSTQRNDNLLEVEYNRRYDNAVKLPFVIKAKNNQKYQLYFNITNDLIEKIFNIKLLSASINNLNNYDRALSQFLYNESLKNEIDYTNQIENIRTSRKNVDLIQKELLDERKRVNEYKLVLYYNKIIKKDLVIENIENLTAIYKEILADYLDETTKINDGYFFRNDEVSIIEGANKLIHQAPDYKVLEQEMKKLVDFLVNEDEINIFIRVAIWHFYFGYLHPYFDGNGRINRFVSVYKLNETLGINSFILSQQLMKNRKLYYELFEETEDIFNRGDLNYFIYSFLDLIEVGLINFEKNIKSHQKQFKKIRDNLEKSKPEPKDKNKKKILFYLFRTFILANDTFTTKEELCKVLNLNESTVKRILDIFEENEYIIKNQEDKSFIYRINIKNDFIKEILEDE